MSNWLIVAPIRLQKNKKAKVTLSLNQYRNWHHQVSNNLKKQFKELVREQIEQLPKLPIVSMTYTLYLPCNRKADVNNIGSVVCKFFEDALVEYGKLEDDNYTFVPTVIHTFGGVDKTNPRVEITIKEFVE